MTSQPSRLTVEPNGEHELTAAGVIDSHTAAELLVALQERGTEADLTLHLDDVEFIDSSGLRSLVTSHQELDSVGHKLILTGVSKPVARLLEITGLQDHLHIT